MLGSTVSDKASVHTGRYKNQESIENRLKRLGFEPVNFSAYNYSNAVIRLRVYQSMEVISGYGRRTETNKPVREARYKVANIDSGVVIYSDRRLSDVVAWLENN